jgi:hypothetical protein
MHWRRLSESRKQCQRDKKRGQYLGHGRKEAKALSVLHFWGTNGTSSADEKWEEVGLNYELGPELCEKSSYERVLTFIHESDKVICGEDSRHVQFSEEKTLRPKFRSTFVKLSYCMPVSEGKSDPRSL